MNDKVRSLGPTEVDKSSKGGTTTDAERGLAKRANRRGNPNPSFETVLKEVMSREPKK